MVLTGMGFPIQPKDLCPIDCDSVWTIDLCYTLKNYCQDFTMYTTHIGVNWEHSNSTFYAKQYHADIKRVHHLFAKAKENFIRIVTTRLSMLDICRFMLSNRYAIIALVDGNILTCHLCAEKKRKQWWRDLCCTPGKKREFGEIAAPIPIPSQSSARSTPNQSPLSNSNPRYQPLNQRGLSSPVNRRLSFQGGPGPSPIKLPTVLPGGSPSSISSFIPLLPSSPTHRNFSYGSITQSPPINNESIYNLLGSEFAGHYIVLIGYDKENDMFFYRDPGTDSELCVVGFDNLEQSMSKETDYDAIVVRVL